MVVYSANNQRNFRDKTLPAPPYRLTCQQEFDDSLAKLEAFFENCVVLFGEAKLGFGS